MADDREGDGFTRGMPSNGVIAAVVFTIFGAIVIGVIVMFFVV